MTKCLICNREKQNDNMQFFVKYNDDKDIMCNVCYRIVTSQDNSLYTVYRPIK